MIHLLLQVIQERVIKMDFFGVTTLLLIACIVFILLSIMQARKTKGRGKMPPGPTPLPILGNILQINGKEVFKSLNKLSEKYGPVYTIHMGTDPVVVLCSYDAVKEALIDNAEDFGARGHMPLLDRISSGGHGVVGSNGERWRQLRRFSLMTLRNFGMGKRSIEQRIQEEAQFLMEEFRKSKSQPLDPTFYFAKAVSNVICSVVFGDRFEYEDKEFLRLLGLLNEVFKGFSNVWGQMYNVYPKIVGKMPGPHHKLFNAIDGIQEFIKQRVQMHKETFDLNDPRDFIDCFLIRMEQEKDITDTEFHMEAIVNTTFDLFGAGTETVSTTLRYGLMILLKNPDVEERIHQEIDKVIGRNRAPCVEDRSRMPYMDAVIHEIQRYIDLIPMGIPHKVIRDLKFRDFLIPKGTTIYPMLSSVLRDPKQFKYPNQFNPGHFLDENGKFIRNDGFMPFSSGKRICLGEGLARMELFLFFTTILQNFSLRSPVDVEELDLTPLMSGFGNFPHYYQLAFIPR
ncbi:cytochrome P450 2C16-like isoform X1 [Anomaloglossus baeobatrachus]|uniref:cytochrome P450 2C16-like isoform X1 n=1 Tax=Anomaloglossus baeobatrachus TaxID=238106 RepID=UPI003F4F69FC